MTWMYYREGDGGPLLRHDRGVVEQLRHPCWGGGWVYAAGGTSVLYDYDVVELSAAQAEAYATAHGLSWPEEPPEPSPPPRYRKLLRATSVAEAERTPPTRARWSDAAGNVSR